MVSSPVPLGTMKAKRMLPGGTMSSPIRERILGAAMETFMEHGVAAAATLEIATRAKVSKRELYAIVGNKQEMLAECIAGPGRGMRLPEGFPPLTATPSLRAAA